ncbi:hypothetical protein BDN72DRAFT_851434 [Pluteus cervinus]|uniref:Uncharacterized protein n=1 Tax=Pluteus cervinus TaxID=181527 RepID=A0ACD3A165_9AGAR|nr:hypothetical protein BDN72DRAFT_851434 [Pluteus cervinus]
MASPGENRSTDAPTDDNPSRGQEWVGRRSPIHLMSWDMNTYEHCQNSVHIPKLVPDRMRRVMATGKNSTSWCATTSSHDSREEFTRRTYTVRMCQWVNDKQTRRYLVTSNSPRQATYLSMTSTSQFCQEWRRTSGFVLEAREPPFAVGRDLDACLRC